MSKVGNILGPAGSVNLTTGIWSSRPSAGTSGHLFFATDVGVLYRDNGASWDVISAGGFEADLTSVVSYNNVNSNATQLVLVTPSLPQGVFSTGTLLEVTAHGIVTFSGIATFTFAIGFGNTVFAGQSLLATTTVAGASNASGSNRPFEYRALMHFTAAPSGNNVSASGNSVLIYKMNVSDPAINIVMADIAPSSLASVASGGALFWNMIFSTSVQSASNTVTFRDARIRILRAGA